MRKYIYENATVYITEPTEEHMRNIKKATEVFLGKVIKEQIEYENKRQSNRRTRVANSNARGRNSKARKDNHSY